MKHLAVIFGVLVLSVIVFFRFVDFEATKNPPPTITHNIVDLDKIAEISKYRSCAGHVVVPTSSKERKRNMKHYFNIKKQYQHSATSVPIYAPFTGKIISIDNIEDNPNDQEISFMQTDKLIPNFAGSDWELGILHLLVLKNLRGGDKVTEGQLIGYAHKNGFDVVYFISAEPSEQRIIEGWYAPYKELDSMFNHMSEKVFNEYVDWGLESKEQIVLTKEQRNATSCIYRDKAPDLEHPIDREENWIKLNKQ